MIGTGGGTVGDALEGARRVLEAAGVAEPRREAAELYTSLVRRPLGAAWLEREAPLAEALAARLDAAARRRAAGWPAASAGGAPHFPGPWPPGGRPGALPRPGAPGPLWRILRRQG